MMMLSMNFVGCGIQVEWRTTSNLSHHVLYFVVCILCKVCLPQHLIAAELTSLEQLLSQPAADGAMRAQALSVAIYCHLLGHDVRFICIHAITLAQQGSLLQKRMGMATIHGGWRDNCNSAICRTPKNSSYTWFSFSHVFTWRPHIV